MKRGSVSITGPPVGLALVVYRLDVGGTKLGVLVRMTAGALGRLAVAVASAREHEARCLQHFERDLRDLPLPCPLATSDTAIMQLRDLLKMTRWVAVFIVSRPSCTAHSKAMRLFGYGNETCSQPSHHYPQPLKVRQLAFYSVQSVA